MPVFLKHRGVWLRIKEVYRIEPRRAKKRGKKSAPRSSAASGMLVAESVDKLPINGMRYRAEIEVSSQRVTRFAAQVMLAAPHVTVVIEPRGEDYVAVVYARTKRELEEHKRLVESIARQLGAMREEEEEIEEEEVEEEVEEEE